MLRSAPVCSLTAFVICLGCQGPSEISESDVNTNLGGQYEIEAIFRDGTATLGWPQYEATASARINTNTEFVIGVAEDKVVSSSANTLSSDFADNRSQLEAPYRFEDLRIHSNDYQLRIAFHRHDLRSCINQPNVWHANLAIERYKVPSAEMGVINIHLAGWRSNNQVCLGILVNGNKGEELFCKALCTNRPTQQDIRNMITAALVTAGIASSVTAGWLANTAAPALQPILFAL